MILFAEALVLPFSLKVWGLDALFLAMKHSLSTTALCCTVESCVGQALIPTIS